MAMRRTRQPNRMPCVDPGRGESFTVRKDGTCALIAKKAARRRLSLDSPGSGSTLAGSKFHRFRSLGANEALGPVGRGVAGVDVEGAVGDVFQLMVKRLTGHVACFGVGGGLANAVGAPVAPPGELAAAAFATLLDHAAQAVGEARVGGAIDHHVDDALHAASAFALGFLFIWQILEGIGAVVLQQKIFPNNRELWEPIMGFFPLQSMYNLIEEPITRLNVIQSAAKQLGADFKMDYHVEWYEMLIVIGWTAIFIYGSYALLKRRDL